MVSLFLLCCAVKTAEQDMVFIVVDVLYPVGDGGGRGVLEMEYPQYAYNVEGLI